MTSHGQIAHLGSDAPGPTIIVIDDDEAVRESTRMLLEVGGYAVRDHASAASFLAAGYGEAFVLLVDHHMPDMMGTDLLEMLHAKRVKAPALLMTGRTDSALEARCRRIGVKLLPKPIAEDHLMEAIEAACRTLAPGPKEAPGD